MGSISYTSHADFVLMWGVSLTRPVLPSFLYREFLLHTPCWLFCFCFFVFCYTFRAVLIFMEGVSLRHPVQASFFFSFFFLGSFSYTSRAFVLFLFVWGGFLFFSFLFYFFAIGGISLTHPVLPSFLYRD